MSHDPPRETAPSTHPHALPDGTRLAEFELRGVIGAGGFGIVYRAFDAALEREVAIKEYLPATLAARGSGHTVAPRAAADADLFALGLRSFVKEARLLARFDHPSLVKVYRYWEQHGTAYMAMPLYHGRTLKQACAAGDGPADDAALLRVVLPVLGALEVLHEARVYHRDVSPDNILLGDDGVPVLLDFGAARRVVGEQTQPLTAILKPRFSPIEQYADVSHLPQGPWTDLYALGAVMRFCVTGLAPVSAAARAVDDQLAPLGGQQHARFSAPVRRAIDWALAVRPQQRPQDVASFRAALRTPSPPTGGEGRGEGARRWIGSAIVIVIVAVAGVVWLRPTQEAVPASASAAAPAVSPAVAPRAVADAAESPPITERAGSADRTASGARKAAPEPVRRAVAAPAEASHPSQACGKRVLLALARCVQRECARPRFRDHAQCVRMRAEMAERRERVALPH